jgi:hypothetical protein
VRAASMTELSEEEFSKTYARNRALSKIMSETRVGEVDGIRFHLRHKEINPDEWTMQDMLGGDDRQPRRRIPSLPFIWFPWYGKFDPDQLKTDVLEEFLTAKEYTKNAPPRPARSLGA